MTLWDTFIPLSRRANTNLQSNLKKMGNGKQSRRKSCLCWAPDVIFHEKEDSDCVEVFPPDIQIRLDQFQSLIEPSVRHKVALHSLPTHFLQRTSTSEKVITSILILITAVSVCFLFWYQNFGSSSSNNSSHNYPDIHQTPSHQWRELLWNICSLISV